MTFRYRIVSTSQTEQSLQNEINVLGEKGYRFVGVAGGHLLFEYSVSEDDSAVVGTVSQPCPQCGKRSDYPVTRREVLQAESDPRSAEDVPRKVCPDCGGQVFIDVIKRKVD